MLKWAEGTAPNSARPNRHQRSRAACPHEGVPPSESILICHLSWQLVHFAVLFEMVVAYNSWAAHHDMAIERTQEPVDWRFSPENRTGKTISVYRKDQIIFS